MIDQYLLSILIDYLDEFSFLKIKDILPNYLKIKYYEKEIGIYELDNLELYEYLYYSSISYCPYSDYLFEYFDLGLPKRTFQLEECARYSSDVCFVTKDNKIMRYFNSNLFEITLDDFLLFIEKKTTRLSCKHNVSIQSRKKIKLFNSLNICNIKVCHLDEDIKKYYYFEYCLENKPIIDVGNKFNLKKFLQCKSKLEHVNIKKCSNSKLIIYGKYYVFCSVEKKNNNWSSKYCFKARKNICELINILSIGELESFI